MTPNKNLSNAMEAGNHSKNRMSAIGMFTLIAGIVLSFSLMGCGKDDSTNDGNGNEDGDAGWGEVKIYESATPGELVAYVTLSIDVSSFNITWRRCDSPQDKGIDIVTNVEVIGSGWDFSTNHISYYTLVSDDFDKYIKAVVTCEGHPGSIKSEGLCPSDNVTQSLATGIYSAVNSTVNSTIVSKVNTLGDNYTSTENIIVNGSISGNAVISDVVKEKNITINPLGAYGKWYAAYKYGFNNFSNASHLTIVSGTGSYLYNGYYNDSKEYRYDYLTEEHLSSCNVIYTNTIGIDYKAHVQIRNYHNIKSTSSYYQTETRENSATVTFENGKEFTWTW